MAIFLSSPNWGMGWGVGGGGGEVLEFLWLLQYSSYKSKLDKRMAKHLLVPNLSVEEGLKIGHKFSPSNNLLIITFFLSFKNALRVQIHIRTWNNTMFNHLPNQMRLNVSRMLS